MTGAIIKLYRSVQCAQAFRWEGQSLEGVRLGQEHRVEADGALVVVGNNGITTRIGHGEWVVDNSPPLQQTFQNVIALTDEAFRKHWEKV
jgi:hypothetical protein